MSSHDFDDTASFPAIRLDVATAAVDRSVAAPRGPQTWARVWRAHLVRLLGQGGLRGSLAAVAAGGTVVGVTAVPVLNHLLDDRSAIDVAVRSADTAALVVAVGWCLAVVLDTAHGSTDGTRLTAAMAVPLRRRHLFTHAAAAATLGASAAAVASLVTGTAAGAALLDGATDAWSGRLLVGSFAAALSTAMLAAMAVAIGSLTRHPALALLALLVWWLAVPTMINAVGTLLPDDATAVATTLSHLFPSTMGGRTVTGDDSATALLANQVGLAAWTGGLLWLADMIEERRDLF